MTDTGKTILVERKFSIYSQFLDTVLQSESSIREGETIKDALLRVHRELEETAVHIRRNAEHPVYGKYPLTPDECIASKGLQTQPYPTQPTIQGVGIIDKSIERLEIAIDNCQSIEELDQLKKDNPLFPARLLESFNKKRKELSK